MDITCERCGYTWMTKTEKKPKRCAKCNSLYYEKPLSDYWKKIREDNKVKRVNKNG